MFSNNNFTNEFINSSSKTRCSLLNFIDVYISFQSASSQATLMNDRLLRAVSYVCAKQIIDLPVLMEKNDCVQYVDFERMIFCKHSLDLGNHLQYHHPR